MNTYLVLLRGINVGGKNKVPMLELKTCLQALGFSNVTTYIASGNAVVSSDLTAKQVKTAIEAALPKSFKLHSELIKVLVLTKAQLQAVIDNKPPGFGDKPETYHSDVVFLIDITTAEALKVFKPRQGVDMVWPGPSVIYSQRLSAQRIKSRLGTIVGTPAYASMTIRNWNTTCKLLELLIHSRRSSS